MTSRRGFLGLFAAAAVLDPERLLWVRGAKTISVPAARELRWFGPISMYGPFTKQEFIWTFDEFVEVINSPLP